MKSQRSGHRGSVAPRRAMHFCVALAAWAAFLTAPAYGQTELSLSSTAIDAGGSGALTLSVSELPENAAGVHVEFTVPASITFGGATLSQGLSGFSGDSLLYQEGNTTRGGFIAYSGSRSIDESQPLASLSFTVGEGVAAGAIPIAITASWLSNSEGTAVLAHSQADGAVLVGGVGEGEGEGEGENLAVIAQNLYNSFDSGDTDNDDALNFDEAVAIRGTLTQGQFDAIDTNSDGRITIAELLAAGAEAPPVGPSCCTPAKTFQLSDLQKYLGDLLLLGMALLVLAARNGVDRKS